METTTKKTDQSLYSKIFFFAFILALLFVPPFNLPGISFKFQIIDFFFPLMVSWIIWKKRDVFKLAYVRNLILFVGVIIVSILFNSKKNSFNDFFEVYDILKYIAVFIVFKEIYQPKIKRIAFDIAFILLLLFNLLHYHDIFGFNEVIMPYFCGDHSIHLLTFGYNSIGEPATKRMLGVIGNPNNNAILFIIFFIFYLPKKGWTTKEMIFFYLSVIAVSACQSRTGIIAFAVIFIFNFILIKWKWWKIALHSTFVTLFLVLFFNLSAFSSYLQLDFLTQKKQKKDYIMSLFNEEGFQGTSWQKRVEIWKNLLGESVHKPIFGHGPQKNHFYEQKLYSENEYVLVIWRYGLVGIIVFLFIYLIPIRNILKNARGDIEAKNILMLILLFMISSLTNVPLSNTTLAPLFFLLMGSYYAQYKTETDLYYLKKYIHKRVPKFFKK